VEELRSGNLKPQIEVKPWQDFLIATYLNVAYDFGRAAERGLKGINTKQDDPWMERVLQYVKKNSLRKAKMITETTIYDLQEIISQGLEEGLPIEEIAAGIGEYYKGIEDWRSLLIARTETHNAANLGTNSFAEEAGMETHTWMAAMDELTREWHAEANGQTVPINEPFEVAGEQLMFPGDDSLGATGMNLCNCRCVETYG